MHLSKISLALRQWGAGAGFSPLSLFASGEQGAWFDPSDLSTMFQDYAGTIPVTADGQPVGLILDKSNGLAATATPIDGAMNTATWTKGTGWSSSGPRSISCDGTNGSTSDCGAAYTKPTGSLVRWTFNIVSISGVVSVYSSSAGPSVFTTTGLKTAFSDPGSSFNIFRASAGTTCTITDIKIELISGNYAYQANSAARPLYKTSGGLHWLQFDGVDDSLATASINFTSTAQIDVFAGLYAPSSATGMLIELSHNATSDGGAFYITDNELVSGPGTVRVRGTDTAGGVLTVTPPDLLVLTNQLAITASPNDYKARINGVDQVDTPYQTGAGTGNFGNWPLYIGQRNQSSLAFNGNIYSLIVLGRTATTQEITDTETWVANKTGVVL